MSWDSNEVHLDHPCKQTCSGWHQGFDMGRDETNKKLEDFAQLQMRVIKQLESALRFYADEKNWKPREYWENKEFKCDSYAIGKDGGAKAREALNE
jgi:hypothetical protein